MAHVGENLLSKLRDGELTLNPSITSALLAMVDAIRQILSCIESEKNEGDVDYSDLVDKLTRLQQGEKETELDKTLIEAPHQVWPKRVSVLSSLIPVFLLLNNQCWQNDPNSSMLTNQIFPLLPHYGGAVPGTRNSGLNRSCKFHTRKIIHTHFKA